MVAIHIMTKHHALCLNNIIDMNPHNWHCIINFSILQMSSLGFTEIISCHSYIMWFYGFNASENWSWLLWLQHSREKVRRLLLRSLPFCGLTILSSLDSVWDPKILLLAQTNLYVNPKNHNNILSVKEVKAR